jgi:hypothetical protein
VTPCIVVFANVAFRWRPCCIVTYVQGVMPCILVFANAACRSAAMLYRDVCVSGCCDTVCIGICECSVSLVGHVVRGDVT